jgi:hypothetical protein
MIVVEWQLFLRRLYERSVLRARVAERISFDEVAEPHRRLEAGGLEGKLVLCPNLPQEPSDGAPPMRLCNSVAESCLSRQ